MKHSTGGATGFERFILGGLILGCLVFAYDYMFAGAQGTGLLWFQMRRAAVDLILWRSDVYLLIFVPVVLALGWVARHTLPVIEIPMLGTSQKEARWIRVWYRPGSVRITGDNITWREGRHTAFCNKSLIAKKGWIMGWGITAPVERNVDEANGRITYDTTNIETYRSQTLNQRLQLALQARAVQQLQEQK